MEKKIFRNKGRDKGFANYKIDESSIIGNHNKIYSVLGIIEPFTKEPTVFNVLNDRRKENLLPLIKNNTSNNNEVEDDNINEEDMINTRNYSDSWPAYQNNDFKQLGFILQK